MEKLFLPKFHLMKQGPPLHLKNMLIISFVHRSRQIRLMLLQEALLQEFYQIHLL